MGGHGVGNRPIVHCYEVQTTTLRDQSHNQRKEPENVGYIGVDKSVDYPGWLQQEKRKWKESREKRKRKRCALKCFGLVLSVHLFVLVSHLPLCHVVKSMEEMYLFRLLYS